MVTPPTAPATPDDRETGPDRATDLAPADGRRIAIGYGLGLIGVTIFGLTLPMTRLALPGFSPFFLAFGRAVIAATLAGAVLLILRRRFPAGNLRIMLAAGICLVIGFPILSSIAMQTLPASHGGIVLGLLPLMTSVFSVIVTGERPSPLFWIWGILGAALVIGFSLRESGLHLAAGDLWLVASALTTSFGYVLSARIGRNLSGWETMAWILVVMSPITVIGTVLSAAWGGIHDPDGWAVTALLYQGTFSVFIGFVFWNAGLLIGGIARVSQVQLFQTFVTLAFSALMLGEHVGIETIIFALAVAFTVWAGRKARIS